jgi:hypothetical protein
VLVVLSRTQIECCCSTTIRCSGGVALGRGRRRRDARGDSRASRTRGQRGLPPKHRSNPQPHQRNPAALPIESLPPTTTADDTAIRTRPIVDRVMSATTSRGRCGRVHRVRYAVSRQSSHQSDRRSPAVVASSWQQLPRKICPNRPTFGTIHPQTAVPGRVLCGGDKVEGLVDFMVRGGSSPLGRTGKARTAGLLHSRTAPGHDGVESFGAGPGLDLVRAVSGPLVGAGGARVRPRSGQRLRTRVPRPLSRSGCRRPPRRSRRMLR